MRNSITKQMRSIVSAFNADILTAFSFAGEKMASLSKKMPKGYEWENLIAEETLIDNPYGAYWIYYKEGPSSGGAITFENYEELKSHIQKGVEPEVSKITVSRFIDDKIETEILYQDNQLAVAE
jgi:hypothetical protein